MNNAVFEKLCEAHICDAEQISKVQDFVRDRDDIEVWKCNKSGAIFLHDTSHMVIDHYDEKAPTHRFGAVKREIISTNDDSQRRFECFKNTIRGRRWLDVGTGSGAVLDVLGPLSSEFAGLEPQAQASAFLSEMGYEVYRRAADVPREKYDVVTLFHVFEHLLNPDKSLRELRECMCDDGTIIIEVPHAKDFLIDHSQAFREHTFWSEHLFLHTRETLTHLVRECGFEVLSVEAVQRYPVANHLHWLIKGQGRGQIEWPFLDDPDLNRSYAAALAKNDMTDTLILHGRKA